MKIYEPQGKAREYSPFALNYYKGCSHNCNYCYVPAIFNRFDKNYNHKIVSLRTEIPTILKSIEASAKRHVKNNKEQVFLNFTSDPYNEQERELNLTKQVLEILLKYKIPTVILTKAGRLVERDIELFKKFSGNIVVGQSLTFDNKDLSKTWESGAASPMQRLIALKELKKHGIKTWASFEPVIDPEESLIMLEKVAKNKLCNFVKIGKLNNYKGLDKLVDWKDFLNKAVSLCRKHELPFYIKKDLLKFKDSSLNLSMEETDQDYFVLKEFKEKTLF